MAKQVGKVLFLGTRLGCTGYLLRGKPYIRRRSTLDGRRCKRDLAFAGSRAAAAVFGGASAFVSRFWRGLAPELKRLMDAGAYNRLLNAAREAHVERASEVVWRSAGKDLPAVPVRVVPSYSMAALGGVLNGLDLSDGQLLPDGLELLVRDGLGDLHHGAGSLLHLQDARRVGFSGLDGLLGLCGTGEAVRVRVLVAGVSVPHGPCLRGMGSAVVGEWVVVEPGTSSVMLDVPAADAAGAMRFVGLEVAVRRRGRWKRLVAACKVYLLECFCGVSGPRGEVDSFVGVLDWGRRGFLGIGGRLDFDLAGGFGLGP